MRDENAVSRPLSLVAPRWLAAVTLPCTDPPSVHEVKHFAHQYAAERLHVHANVFDGIDGECGGALRRAGVARVTYVSGFKTLYWRRALTPNVTATYDLIWLLDCDLRISPHLFSISEVEHWLETTGTSIIQPSVVPYARAGRAGRGGLTRSQFSADCLARVVPCAQPLHIDDHLPQGTRPIDSASEPLPWACSCDVPSGSAV